MKTPIFTGSAAALATPFDPSGALDLEALDRLIRRQLESGTRALVVCATTGECATLSDGEWELVLRRAVTLCQGKIPVIAGAGRNSTQKTVELCRRAGELGADGVLLVTPYYNKTTQAGLVTHYLRAAEESPVPVILYNVPSRTGMTIEPETYALLSAHPNIAGTKEASGDLSRILRLRRLCPPDFALYSGNDDQILPILALGGVGVISTMANLIPRETQALCAAWEAGEREEALRLQLWVQPLVDALFREVNPIPLKSALEKLGLCGGTVREPLCPLSPGGPEVLWAVMSRLRLL